MRGWGDGRVRRFRPRLRFTGLPVAIGVVSLLRIVRDLDDPSWMVLGSALVVVWSIPVSYIALRTRIDVGPDGIVQQRGLRGRASFRWDELVAFDHHDSRRGGDRSWGPVRLELADGGRCRMVEVAHTPELLALLAERLPGPRILGEPLRPL